MNKSLCAVALVAFLFVVPQMSANPLPDADPSHYALVDLDITLGNQTGSISGIIEDCEDDSYDQYDEEAEDCDEEPVDCDEEPVDCDEEPVYCDEEPEDNCDEEEGEKTTAKPKPTEQPINT